MTITKMYYYYYATLKEAREDAARNEEEDLSNYYPKMRVSLVYEEGRIGLALSYDSLCCENGVTFYYKNNKDFTIASLKKVTNHIDMLNKLHNV